MSTIVTRAGKGSPLTWNEVDNNFTNLNTDKLQSGNTAAALTITSATINGGTIDATAIGGSTPAAGAFTSGSFSTTLGVTGVATLTAQPILSSLTASSAVATDASKGLVSVTNTGTGNNVLATSPTITGATLTTAALNGTLGATTPSTAVVTSLTDSGLTSGRVTYASTGGLLADSASLTYDGTTLTSTKFAGAFNGTLGATTPSTVVATTIDGTTSIRTTKTFEYPALGSMDGAIKMLSTSGVYGLFGGVSSGGYSWLQTGRNDANATAYTLYLNNQGGDVNLASNKVIASSTGLAVTGLISATTTGQVGTTIGVGAATPSTSGAGITFPATQSASTDANTLDDYEEGTWTPNQGAGLTVVGAFSSSGTYTKIGNLVTVTGILFGATSIATGVGGLVSSNLPFAKGAGSSIGRGINSAWTSGTDIIPSAAVLYSVTATTANPYIFFSVTYQT